MLKACRVGLLGLHCKLIQLSPKIEHWCVVSYAGAEVFGQHPLMFYASIGIGGAGVLAIIWERMNGNEKPRPKLPEG